MAAADAADVADAVDAADAKRLLHLKNWNISSKLFIHIGIHMAISVYTYKALYLASFYSTFIL